MKDKVIFILKILILVVLFVWVVIVFTDYFRVRTNNDPIFCKSETIEYDDGYDVVCTGLGYKTIKYNRTCRTASEFGPFFIKERQC